MPTPGHLRSALRPFGVAGYPQSDLRRDRLLRDEEPPGADPHAGWCGGRGRETPAYPISKIILSSAVAHLELLNIESSQSSLPRHHPLILESSMLLRVPQGLDRVLQNLAHQLV